MSRLLVSAHTSGKKCEVLFFFFSTFISKEDESFGLFLLDFPASAVCFVHYL